MRRWANPLTREVALRRLMTISALAVLIANAPHALAQNAAGSVAPPSPLSAKAMVLG